MDRRSPFLPTSKFLVIIFVLQSFSDFILKDILCMRLVEEGLLALGVSIENTAALLRSLSLLTSIAHHSTKTRSISFVLLCTLAVLLDQSLRSRWLSIECPDSTG